MIIIHFMKKNKLFFAFAIIAILIFFILGFCINNHSYSINVGQKNQKKDSESWNLEAINLADSWDITKGNKDIRVAVIGYGIDADNKYLKDNIVDSWNFVTGSPEVIDENGHGTFAAGIILSIAPNVSIINEKIFDGNQEVQKLDEAIDYAVKKNADIILMPIVILDSVSPHYVDKAQSKIIYAYSKGIKFVLGAQGRGNCLSHRFPGYLDGVYNIAGIDKNYGHSANSTANDLSFIAAPSDDIDGIETIGDWKNIGGTSWSSAHIAGIVSLMLSANPYLERKDIENILISNAIDLGPEGKDNYFGWGLVNCYNSVKDSKDTLIYKIMEHYLEGNIF